MPELETKKEATYNFRDDMRTQFTRIYFIDISNTNSAYFTIKAIGFYFSSK